jgi:hypothetical protein
MNQICINKVCFEFSIYHFVYVVLLIIVGNYILDLCRTPKQKLKENLFNINYDLPDTKLYPGQYLTRSTLSTRSDKDIDEINKDYDKYNITKPQITYSSPSQSSFNNSTPRSSIRFSPEPAPKSDSEPKSEYKSKSKSKSKYKSKYKSEPESESESEPEPEPESESESEPTPKPRHKPTYKPKSNSRLKYKYEKDSELEPKKRKREKQRESVYDYNRPIINTLRPLQTLEEQQQNNHPPQTLMPEPGRQIPNTNYPNNPATRLNPALPVMQIPNGGLTDYELIRQRDLGIIANPLAPPERRTERPTIDMTLPLLRNKYIGLPTRGSYDTYQQTGYLVDNTNSDNILKLFGRQKYPGSTQYEYYAMKSTSADQYKIPLYDIKKQLFDNDSVTLVKLFPGTYKYVEFKQEELI